MLNNLKPISQLKLQDILNEKELDQVLKIALKHQNIKGNLWKLFQDEIKPATDGLSGFLGDHFKARVLLKNDINEEICLCLFIKTLPLFNKPKSEFIDFHNYFRREMLMYTVFEEINDDEGPNLWHPKVYLCNERKIVMPDLSTEGYITLNKQIYFDLSHVHQTIRSVAEFHAYITKYETMKTSKSSTNYTLLEEHREIFEECGFSDTPWFRAGIKVVVNFLKTFSTKYTDLSEEKLHKFSLEVCDGMREYKGTLNTVIHKDLWTNNIMFRYEGNVLSNALILDYQCIRYGPPAFDVMTFLYLTTSRSFRTEYEDEVLKYYFKNFMNSLDESSKKRIKGYGYNFDEFVIWCEKARMFAIVVAVLILPYVLMDSKHAQDNFDNADTYEKYNTEDRSEPILSHADVNNDYKEKLLKVFVEYAERFLSFNSCNK